LLGETHADVLTVPLNVIRATGDGAKYVVVVDQDGVQRDVPVTTGLTQGKLTEVAGDLHEGDQVLLHTMRSTSFGSSSSNQ
jgi:multidrug efflux pump subunit AcrA (membrane-fusion protein)